MATPTSKKRKQAFSLDFKMQILREVDEKKLSKAEIAKKNNIAQSTLSTFLKNRQSIEEAVLSSSFQPNRKRLRTVNETHQTIDSALFTWVKQARAVNLPLSGPLMCSQAIAIAQNLGVDFEPNPSWLQRFKDRHGIVYKEMSGEAASVSNETVNKWTETTLPSIIEPLPWLP